ncbi:YaaA family protein [Mycoplasmatota bacterium WC30]
MKIILSPSKKQITDILDSKKSNTILFGNHTNKLFSYFKSLSKNDLQSTLKIKGQLLDKTYNLYQSSSVNNPGIEAINCYQGVVFEQIYTEKYNLDQSAYLEQHLVILSAMYGALKSNTIMWPYRLDMTIKLKGIQLYDYWQKSVDEYFDNEDYIINLASNEFSKMIKRNKKKMINIYFQEEQEDKSLKTISYNAKKSRGIMANILIINQVQDIREIKGYNIDGYIFNENLSDKFNYYFVKQRFST